MRICGFVSWSNGISFQPWGSKKIICAFGIVVQQLVWLAKIYAVVAETPVEDVPDADAADIRKRIQAAINEVSSLKTAPLALCLGTSGAKDVEWTSIFFAKCARVRSSWPRRAKAV